MGIGFLEEARISFKATFGREWKEGFQILHLESPEKTPLGISSWALIKY